MENIYLELHHRFLCSSKSSFFQDWCGVKPEYLAVKKFRNQEPSLAVLFRLWDRLDRTRGQRDLARQVMAVMRAQVSC
jgi:hypothetical protein